MNTVRIPVAKQLFLGALFAMQLAGSTHAAVELAVQTSTIGHAFFDPNLPELPEIETRSAVDSLVDQDQSSGGGGLLPAVSVNWDTNTQFTLTVSAPPGQKFLVRVPAGRAVGFGGFLWWESTRGGFSPPGAVTVSFSDLEGTPPIFSQSDSVLSDSHGFFGFPDLEGTTVTNDFAFTSIRLTGTALPQVTGNGTEDYLAHRESSLHLSYRTPETNDPGRFVFLVPALLPRIEVVAGTSPDAGIEFLIFGRAGRTHVVECSPDTVSWIPISTNVMPAIACPACPSVAVKDLSSSSADNRFYRVVELP